jgi:uncharacterized cupredoxin-like copper-binding protein
LRRTARLLGTNGTRRVAAALLFVATVAGLVSGCGDDAPPTEATVEIEFSRFTSDDEITVAAGVPVTFTLVNGDPIDHEWIIGPPDVHERHRTGTEPYHDEVPTEVTIPAYETRTTTVTFEEPGEYVYICHLPGHEAYGMVGKLLAVSY